MKKLSIPLPEGVVIDPTKLDKIESLEKKMLEMPQAECSVEHKFGPGVYIREVHFPADTYAIGHEQNFEHMNVFVKGRITIFDNGVAKEIKAPMVFVGKPGRKIGYIHEESIWLNIYPTEEQNIEKLEAKYLTKSNSWMENQVERQNVALLTSSVDKEDYENVLKEFNFTEEVARAQAENPDDMTDLPFGNYKIKTGFSNIEGTGLFATSKIDSGEIIAPARLSGKRTIAGRYTNHSKTPNAEMISLNNNIYLKSLREISGCRGGQDGEEITIDYRKALRLNYFLEREAKCQQSQSR